MGVNKIFLLNHNLARKKKTTQEAKIDHPKMTILHIYNTRFTNFSPITMIAALAYIHH
jgi:hypothetical protein